MDSIDSCALGLLQDRYGLTGTLDRLPGELDLNLRLTTETGSRALLRIYAANTDRNVVDYEIALLLHVALADPQLPIQRVLPGLDGEVCHMMTAPDGTTRFVRLSSWLEGGVWAHSRGEHDHSAAQQVGRTLALLDRSLESLEHPVANRHHRWDLANATDHISLLSLIDDIDRRTAATEILSNFRDIVLPKLHGQPKQIVHNDANDYNVLLNKDHDLSGLIDFGDSVYTFRVNEVAIGCCYAMLGSAQPISLASQLISAYHEVSPLSEIEVEVLFDLILTRAAVSMCLAAQQIRDDPTNTYLLISQQDMWSLVQQLRTENRSLAIMSIHVACGLNAVANQKLIERWLERSNPTTAPVLQRDLSANRLTVLDLRAEATTTMSLAPLFDDAALEHTVPLGRYGEDRSLYNTDEFATPGSMERRTIHIGIDLFAPAGENICAPLSGTVADIGHETVPLGFGGILVLRHETSDGTPFWTLFGHLSPSSLSQLTLGQAVGAGEVVARLGTTAENGGWPPHLHFQVMSTLCGWTATQIPGVVTRSQWEIWRSVFLNPNLVLGLHADCSVVVERDPAALRHERRSALGQSLSLAYDEPLKIVRGEGIHLIDHAGRRYLDMVNNVCHVGHCHPRVVAAGQRQMAILNTNTRYLHDNLLEYSRRLTSTLPDELSVVFMVNSGSEANDLALRLARAYTGQHDIVTVDHAYHGNLTSIVDISPYKFAGPGGGGKRDYVWVAEMPDTFRGRLRRDHPNPGLAYADHVQILIQEMAALGRLPAAFFSEGILGTGGMMTLPEGYLANAFSHVRRAGGLCVSDEVQLGFGRVGSQMWAFELQGVVPDIVTTGKPIGNGHPMAAVITRPDIADAFANGMEYFSTFGGNPVSAAIGLAVLDVIRDERLLHNAHRVGTLLMDGVRCLAERYDLIGDVRGSGLFIGIELVRDRQTLEPAAAELAWIIQTMKEQHVLLSSEGPLHNVMKIKPPIIFSEDNVNEFLTKLDDCLATVPRVCAS